MSGVTINPERGRLIRTNNKLLSLTQDLVHGTTQSSLHNGSNRSQFLVAPLFSFSSSGGGKWNSVTEEQMKNRRTAGDRRENRRHSKNCENLKTWARSLWERWAVL